MIKKVYTKLKSKGIGGLLKNVYCRALPQRLKCYPHYKSIFQSGVGLEIGGPSDIFGRRGHIPVYQDADRIDNCDFAKHTVCEWVKSEGENFIFDKDKAPGRQYVAEGSNLRCIEDSSYDFILSSHSIEHLANPLRGIAEWIRILKPEGLLVLVVPHKDGTFDHRRPVTLFEHLLNDYESQTDESDMTHLEEILRLHDLSIDPGAGDFQFFQERSKRNEENRCLHHHVFDTRLAVEAVNYMGLQIRAVELFHPYHIVIIAKKIGREEAINNERFRGIDGAPCWVSSFPSDRLTHHKMA